MTSAAMTKRISRAPGARVALGTKSQKKFLGVYYLLTILTGIFILSFHGKLAFVADLIVALFYLAVTALFHDLSRNLPVRSNDLRSKPDHPRVHRRSRRTERS